MSLRCIHISDIHFRGLSRHEEYRESFKKFFSIAKDLKPNMIFLGGDIVHSKTQGISPELIDVLSWWFTELAKVAPTHIILGNHDGLVLNKHRQDAITPIVSALNNENLYLYKDSGNYPLGGDLEGYSLAVFSCFDTEKWKDVKPIDGLVNIGTFHGSVVGSKTDADWQLEADVDLAFFKGYDFVFLGDIHKMQYLDDEKRVAYPGSAIQQNYGEDPGKGFLFWEIDGKDKYTSTFYEIPHSKPFVTIDYPGDIQGMLDASEVAPDGARFRVRLKTPLPQAEIKQIYSALKEFKSASEVVLKQDFDLEVGVIHTSSGKLFTDDLRDSKTHKRLLREYYSSMNLSDDDWSRLDLLVDKYLSLASKDDNTPRNIKWMLKRMEFDNTFSYGKGNVVNFDNLSGITGIFGKNRTGKSSIPGTLMYGMFNTTDRGPIKNLHIINSRKGHCLTKIDFSVNGRLYRAARQSVKHQTRKGLLHATTHLNLHMINSQGEVVKDMNEEQRRETEKILRSMVGSSDDFLLTSLASQGEMNTFLKHRATKRKEILANFLDLGVFELMLGHIREDSSDIKGALKSVPDREWDTLIDEKSRKLALKTEERDEISDELQKSSARLQHLRIVMATHKDKDLVTPGDVSAEESRFDKSKAACDTFMKEIEELEIRAEECDLKMSKIENLRSQFPIDELKKQWETQQDLERSLRDLEHQRELEKQLLSSKKKLVKKLEPCDCFEHLPTCEYVKQSDKQKAVVEEQSARLKDSQDKVRGAKRALKKIKDLNLDEKIKKYDDILEQERDLLRKGSEVSLLLSQKRQAIDIERDTMRSSREKLDDLRSRVTNDESSLEISGIKNEIRILESETRSLDAEKLSLSELLGRLASDIKKLGEEKEKYIKLLGEWKTFDLLMGAFSKKGIPLQIMMSQLPAINEEIAKILQGVTGFTVELEADTASNAMDIYINYGDSRRVIECASGMEKMMASLAIRVAFINISSLPRTDVLIIDEGFGALDDTNIESCSRLLESLKKWFKNILVISHVDAIKDAVDNVLDITSDGKDSQVVHE